MSYRLVCSLLGAKLANSVHEFCACREGLEPSSAQQEEDYEGLMRQSRAVLSSAEGRFGQRVEKSSGSSEMRQYAQTVPFASQLLRNTR